MRVLGVDPGLGITGYGLVEETDGGTLKVIEAGCVRTSARSDLGARLMRIYRGLDGLIREHRPHIIALEELYSHYKHPTTAIMMGHARGAVCLLAGAHGIRVVGYPSTKVKKAITGNGMASKYQVQQTIRAVLGLKSAPEPFDVSDALAVAVSHFYIAKKRRFL